MNVLTSACQSKKKGLVLKIDLERAYDQFRWDFWNLQLR